MTKIYLIKHLDSGMKYVGITDGDLVKRWLSHMIDKKSAVYEALRSEGYRMTMELLEEVPSRDEALRKEQEYIRTLGTAQPHGWNRMVSKVEVVKPAVKKWIECKDPLYSQYIDQDIHGISSLRCPICNYYMTHHQSITIYTPSEKDKGFISHIERHRNESYFGAMTENPSSRQEGIRIMIACENCHPKWLCGDKTFVYRGVEPPLFSLLIYHHEGGTLLEIEYCVEEQES
jgi:predicted GIY-YIG superfamily endonuclease